MSFNSFLLLLLYRYSSLFCFTLFIHFSHTIFFVKTIDFIISSPAFSSLVCSTSFSVSCPVYPFIHLFCFHHSFAPLVSLLAARSTRLSTYFVSTTHLLHKFLCVLRGLPVYPLIQFFFSFPVTYELLQLSLCIPSSFLLVVVLSHLEDLIALFSQLPYTLFAALLLS